MMNPHNRKEPIGQVCETPDVPLFAKFDAQLHALMSNRVNTAQQHQMCLYEHFKSFLIVNGHFHATIVTLCSLYCGCSLIYVIIN
jgi:hypothetical protein